MTNAKTTKRALLSSVLALFLCFAMLLGTTFAWFTDSVTSANNIIKSGNLDIELEYWDGDSWEDVAGKSDILTNTLYEPGVTEVAYLKVTNAGTLALKYQLGVNIVSETTGKNVAGETLRLSDYIMFGVVEGINGETGAYANRDDAVAAVTGAQKISAGYTKAGALEAGAAPVYLAMVVYMPTSVGNEANHDGTNVPSIDLGINVFATQNTVEADSFDDQYDVDAPVVTYNVDPSNVQDYLDGKYASLKNVKLVLEAGDYGVLYLGRPTKYVGSNTEYFCETHDFTTTDAEAFKAHYADGNWHTTPKYSTTLENLMIVGEDGAKVAGLVFTTGHSYGDVYDYVRDIDYTSGSAYYSTARINDVTIENVEFTGQANFNTSDATTVIDGVTFNSCSFTTGGTASANGAAIRYYNEANNGNVKNLAVENCEFKNCYQGIYTSNVNGVSVVGSTFDTLGHNAIALQSQSEAVNLKSVVIKNNVMKNVDDRVIRFNNVGADSQITIQYNVAVDSGDDGNEIIKATSLAAGIKYDVNYNDWGGKTVVNPELKDSTGAAYVDNASDFSDAITNGNTTIILDSGNYVIPSAAKGKTLTIVGNGDTSVAVTKVGTGGENCDYGLDGSNVVFENITITTNSSTYIGYARCNATYNNCTINGTYTLYGNSVFNDCTFNVTGDVYNIWTWGAPTAEFNNCTFNSDGKALLLYGTANTKLTVNGCTFNDNGGLADLKAAIEIGNDYGTSYELIVNNTVVNGYEENDKGILTGTTLWANKNSMGSDKLNVVIDGVDIY